ncbi:MAG TPA: flippase-like domain-containing protein [Acidiferrobacteraceae bacterium]|nr:flippase-like domain-containing protein [Acidiferrobacteraceae bacterium]
MNKKFIFITIKIIVSGALIYWILTRVSLEEVFAAMANARTGVLVVAFLMYFVGYSITAIRWRLLLHAQGVEVPLFRLVQSFMVALFFNNFLPSTIGGDAVRVYDSWRFSGSKTRAVAVVFTDRVFGMLALMLIATLAAMVSEDVVKLAPNLQLWLGLILAGLVAVVGAIFFTDKLSHLLLKGLDNAPVGLLRKLGDKLTDVIQAFHGRHDVASKALGLSILLQVNVIIHFFLIGYALQLSVPVLAFFVIIPIAIVIMMLPVTINGIGLRESVFVFLLGAYGVSQADAVAFAWISFGFVILQGVVGGVVYALRNESSSQKDSKMKSTSYK